MTSHIDLDAVVLKAGAHSSPDDGACLLEVVAMFAHEPFTDRPACVSPILAAFGRAWNDGMRTDDERAQLKQYIPRLAGTAGDWAADERRGVMAADWLIRTYTPAWLRLAGLTEQADRIAGLPEITSFADTVAIKPALEAVRADAAAAWAAARDAARDAAWDAARDAAWDAAWAAAWAAARDAAWAAARDAAWAAARDAAWAAAWDAAWAAAWAAARDAARDAAWDAARDALNPTVEALQASAHDLFGRMIEVRVEVPS